MLEDIAILTGGKPSPKTSASSSRTSSSKTSAAPRSVTIDKDNTTIVEGAGKKADIKGRVKQIRRQIDETTSTTTARSSRSASPSSPAAWPSSTSAPPPKPK
jgi:chaperonin GroEL